MPTHDAPEHPLAVILGTAFAAQLESGEVSLVVFRDHISAFEVQADEWTLRLEGWPVATSFIALDEEPTSLKERQAALDAAIDDQNLAGLRDANNLLDNAIVAALEDSGDELSALLAQFIAVSDDDFRADPEEA
ncbi:MAG: hypothetical protein M3457_11645 [Chloroflexota bacterium]|nr:hypothetical protein [Chloroflexota bacterium]